MFGFKRKKLYETIRKKSFLPFFTVSEFHERELINWLLMTVQPVLSQKGGQNFKKIAQSFKKNFAKKYLGNDFYWFLLSVFCLKSKFFFTIYQTQNYQTD